MHELRKYERVQLELTGDCVGRTLLSAAFDLNGKLAHLRGVRKAGTTDLDNLSFGRTRAKARLCFLGAPYAGLKARSSTSHADTTVEERPFRAA